MKVKVLRRFKDKYTEALHERNTTVEMTKERSEEINSTSLGIFVEAISKELEEMTRKELVAVSKDKGVEINSRMTKAEIIDTLKGV